MADAARRIYDLQLERVYLRAARAVARPGGGEGLAGVERALASVEAELSGASPMDRLVARFGLDDTLRDLVWAAVAFTGDPRVAIPASALVGSDARRGMTLALFSLLADLDGSAARGLALRLTPAHPLLRHRLLEIAPGEPMALRASPRLAGHLAGVDALDPVLAACGGRVSVPARALFDAAQEVALLRLAQGLADDESLVLLIEGPVGSGRRTAAAIAASRHGRDIAAIDVKRLPPTLDALDAAAVALGRECMLGGGLPLIAEIDDLVDAEGSPRLRALGRFLDDQVGPVIVTSSRPGLDLGARRRVLRVEWPVPDIATRRALWSHYVGAAGAHLGDDELGPVALRHVLGAGGIERAVDSARLLARARGQRDHLDASDLIAGIRNNIAERLGSLARRVDVKQSWADLVLAPDLLDQVHALIARVRHSHRVYEDWRFGTKAARGIGVPALLSGPPGTGKTMVAGVIARELGLELLQVDLSQVVSKWIGETEKQLSAVFDAAEAGHALLLFDEADSLFAKRTEVRGSTDRYANLEVNYLLQRVESFGGITILTTNFETTIDPALKRRLAAHIVFWPPDDDEREDLWKRMLDTGAAPIAGALDLSRLAHAFPDMTGANIRNAVLAAAFLAASDGVAITQAHLERAAKGEYRTMGRVLR